ncbi:hypothetical protein [Nigerium massiliense]|uniref:hypothetical protein n=1 Tax=Nigerium massiliense TaxID=1522317 RepID=UPI00058F07A8|nr:hypothetical protein [Nigerium massiliense]
MREDSAHLDRPDGWLFAFSGWAVLVLGLLQAAAAAGVHLLTPVDTPLTELLWLTALVAGLWGLLFTLFFASRLVHSPRALPASALVATAAGLAVTVALVASGFYGGAGSASAP